MSGTLHLWKRCYLMWIHFHTLAAMLTHQILSQHQVTATTNTVSPLQYSNRAQSWCDACYLFSICSIVIVLIMPSYVTASKIVSFLFVDYSTCIFPVESIFFPLRFALYGLKFFTIGPNHASQSHQFSGAGASTQSFGLNQQNPSAGGDTRRQASRPFGSNIHTLRHDEDDFQSTDRNTFWNGNSTEFGGDDKK